MSDPVMGSDGQTYEREAITQWLRSNPHSPLTRQPMTVQSLKPNYSLKAAIERFKSAPLPQQPRQQPQAKQKPRPPPKKAAPRHPPVPSAPPPDDLAIAIQLQHEELTQRLLPQTVVTVPTATATATVVPTADAARRRQQAILMCACVGIGVIFVVILSKLLGG
jgi:hypothetical protein